MSPFHPKQVLCPIDFSEHSAAALRVAGGVARAFGAKVIVLHAQRLEAPAYFTAAQAKALRAQLRRSARAARKFVRDFAAPRLPEGVEYSVLLLEDDPVVAIRRVSRDLRAGLIVMGTHGRTGLARIRLGSVMESVLRQVTAPVLTVGPHITPTASLAMIRRVLCPVNYSDLALEALAHAAAVAERAQAVLAVIHVLENGAGSDERESHLQLCEWISADIRSSCTVQEVLRQGSAAEQIVAEARAYRADLIVVGAHPRSFLGTILFGSTTELVIRKAPCPVLSVIRK
jgi:nucleotide-binding universal stress UspA family protein